MKLYIMESAMDKIITLSKDKVDIIRKRSFTINNLLSNSIFKKYDNLWLKGGISRLALMLYLNQDVDDSDVRDIDTVAFFNDYNDDYYNFSKEEFYGIDVERTTMTPENFLLSTDFSFNSVLLRPDKMIFTRRAYKSILDKKIKKKDDLLSYVQDERGAARLLLFAARYGYRIPNEVKFKKIEDGFEFLIVTLKAYELGIQNKFFNLLKKYNLNLKSSNIIMFLLNLLKKNNYFTIGDDRIHLLYKDLINNDKNIEDIKHLLSDEIKNALKNFEYQNDIPKNILRKFNRKDYSNI